MPSIKNYTATFPTLILALGAASAQSHLDGASGRLFNPDLENGSFEFLTKTEYDPKSDIGKSRFTVHWADDVELVKMEELEDFSSVSAPVQATFKGITQANRKALAEGEPFVARVVTFFEGLRPEKLKDPKNEVSGVFSPVADGSRSGMLEVDGNKIEVSLRDRHWRIFYRKRIQPRDLKEGFWTVTVHGVEGDSGRFVADRLEVGSLPDPRASDNPDLPGVLVIGDSISMNYHEAAKEALTGVANYHRIQGNGFSVEHGVDNAELWLGNYFEPGFHWDVILFNHGLHDLKQAYDPETDTFGAYAVPIEEYQAGLEKLIGILKKTGAQLVWTSTTPVPNHNKGKYARRKGAAREFNAAAMAVMRRHPEILINDLYEVVDDSPVYDDWREGTDVHFYKEEERGLLGKSVATAVKKALALRGAKPHKKLVPQSGAR